MATHGPCETEGPGPHAPDARTCQSGIRDITPGTGPAAPQSLHRGSRITSSPAAAGPPGDNGPPPDGQATRPTSYRLTK